MSETKPTPVRKLIKSVEGILDAYADNLNAIAKGKEVKYPIEDKTIDTVIKIVKEMSNFEQFEKIANPELKQLAKTLETKKPIDNMLEHVIKQKTNGYSKV